MEDDFVEMPPVGVIGDDYEAPQTNDDEGGLAAPTAKVPYDDSGFDLAAYVAKKLGSEEFMTGSQENPIKYNVRDLSTQQLVAMLEDMNRPVEEQVMDIDETEQTIINMLREGRLEELYQELGKELGQNNQPAATSEYSLEDYMTWQIRENAKASGAELTDQEVEETLNSLKDAGTFNKLANGAKNRYNQLVQQEQERQRSQQEEAERTRSRQALEQEITSVREIINSMDEFYGLDMEDEDGVAIRQQAFRDLAELDEEGRNPLSKVLDTPEGLVEMAVMRATMPRLIEYMQQMQEELDQLKASKGSVVIKNDNRSAKAALPEQYFISSKLEPFEG